MHCTKLILMHVVLRKFRTKRILFFSISAGQVCMKLMKEFQEMTYCQSLKDLKTDAIMTTVIPWKLKFRMKAVQMTPSELRLFHHGKHKTDIRGILAVMVCKVN